MFWLFLISFERSDDIKYSRLHLSHLLLQPTHLLLLLLGFLLVPLGLFLQLAQSTERTCLALLFG